MKVTILVFAALTALFWGCYGPALALSRTGLGSPFKPYFLIGVAYLAISVAGGALGMAIKGDVFSFTGAGAVWGFAAGSLGALGALSLTFAMFSGGSRVPHVVMSIVFGGAVSVTALITLLRLRQHGESHHTSPWLWIGMLVVAVGTILVTLNTPAERPPGQPSSAPTPAPSGR